MKLSKIISWLDAALAIRDYADDVSNNGVQISRVGDEVKLVAFAVDASVKSVQAAAKAGAQLLVVHHGISWGGGIRRLTGGVYNVVHAAIAADLGLYAAHLPLDANKDFGNNWEIARAMKLKKIVPAFNYHGHVIGVVGIAPDGKKVGVCSGGAGDFAVEAKELGCERFVTGEANWGEVIAAENVGMKMECRGHYETETYGVKALAKKLKAALKVPTIFVALAVMCGTLAASAADSEGEEDEFADAFQYEYDRWSVGVVGQMVFPQGGSRMSRRTGAGVRLGYYVTEMLAIEGEAMWMEQSAGLALKGLWHWWGYEQVDPFFTFGARGWIHDGQVGPCVGAGAFYHLNDYWSIRFDADATLGLDTDCEMIYSVGVGVQRTF